MDPLPEANQTPPEQIVTSEHPADRVGKTKTIYQMSAWSIFWRNFLAGFSRSLGGIIIYLIFLGIIGYYSYQTLLPRLLPILQSYTTMMQSLTNQGRPSSSSEQIMDNPLIQQFLKK